MKTLLKILFRNHWKKISLIFILAFINVQSQLYLIELIPIILHHIKTGNYDATFLVLDNFYIAIAVSLICMLLTSYLSLSVSSNFTSDLKQKIFSILMNANNVQEYCKNRFSGLMSRTIRAIDTLQSFVIILLKRVILFIMASVWVIYSLIDLDIVYASLFAVFLVVFCLLFWWKLNQMVDEYFLVRKHSGILNSLFRDKIIGLKTIKMFSKEDSTSEIFEEELDETYNLGYRFRYRLSYLLVFLIVLHIVLILFILWGLFIFDANKTLAVEIFLSLLYILYLVNHINAIIPFVNGYTIAYTASIRIEQTLALEHAPNPPAMRESDFEGIEFNNVSVSIFGMDILSDVSFKIPKNSKNLIIGPVGAGKSSLIYSLTGFYENNSGSILINGKNIKSKSFDDKISLTSNHHFMVKGNVFQNISLGDESITREDAIQACDDALFTKDLSFEVYERGSNLSTDLKQRLAIARALAHDYEIYVFDNSFSQIESTSRRIIKENIKKRLSGKILIFIDNTFDDYSDMDNILVMENSSLVCQGSHDFLIENCETYRRLINCSGGK
ncbi:MAG: ABC transporter ATP-binding protein [Methanobrevibacter sp.]|nr:ABC transporter ATP-binding protein [Methanobrevibacter sp.]